MFLREYIAGADNQLHSTGKMLDITAADGSEHMATWADVKANALKLGILLTDKDVGNVPLLATDAYGNFIAGGNGFAQVVVLNADGATTSGRGQCPRPRHPLLCTWRRHGDGHRRGLHQRHGAQCRAGIADHRGRCPLRPAIRLLECVALTADRQI